MPTPASFHHSRGWHYLEAERLLAEYHATKPVKGGVYTITPPRLTEAAVHAALAGISYEAEDDADFAATELSSHGDRR